MSGPEDRWLCGWRVATALPLDELLPWTGDDRPPDLAIRLADSAVEADMPRDLRPGLHVTPDGSCTVTVDGVAAYRIDAAARSVTILPVLPPSAPAIRLFLLGSVFAIICFRRGLIPLHACCVEIDGEAVAFSGPSEAGKSTLAAAFSRHGHRILADDLTVVTLATRGRPAVLPAFPRVKLWGETIRALALPEQPRAPVREGMDKYSVRLDGAFQPQPMPLGSLYYLEDSQADQPAVAPVRGFASGAAVMDAVYRPRLAARMGLADDLFAASMDVAAVVPGYRLARRRSLAELDRLIATVLEHERVRRSPG